VENYIKFFYLHIIQVAYKNIPEFSLGLFHSRITIPTGERYAAKKEAIFEQQEEVA